MFPEEKEDGDTSSNMLLFLPKRRFARKTPFDEFMNPLTRLLMTGTTGDPYLMAERAMKDRFNISDRLLYSYIRDIEKGMERTLVLAPRLSGMKGSTIGKLEPFWRYAFPEDEPDLDARDKVYQFWGYLAEK